MFHAAASASNTMGARTVLKPLSTEGNASIMFLPMIATRGATLVATVPMASKSCVVSAEKSTSSRPRPVRKLSHAALAMLIEPWMVVAASKEVVPVMPISV